MKPIKDLFYEWAASEGKELILKEGAAFQGFYDKAVSGSPLGVLEIGVSSRNIAIAFAEHLQRLKTGP